MPKPLLPDPPLFPPQVRQISLSQLTLRFGDAVGLHGIVLCITRCSGTLSRITCGFLSRSVRYNTHTLRPQRVIETPFREDGKKTQIQVLISSVFSIFLISVAHTTAERL